MMDKTPKPARNRIVVLDFSGTLSLGAALFGREVNLRRELKKASLWAAGLNDPELFWEVIGATWDEGSTTGIGYQQILYKNVRRISSETGGDEALRVSISRFANSYFEHSTIAAEWAPLLRKLAERPAVVTVVATDHYAEATEHICRQLETFGVAAAPVGGAGRGDEVAVANSADLGSHKWDRAFWRKVGEKVGLQRPERVVLVDDFGHNEAATDEYALAEKVAARHERTAAVLEERFHAPVAVFPFFLKRNAEGARHRGFAALVRRATEFVLQHARHRI